MTDVGHHKGMLIPLANTEMVYNMNITSILVDVSKLTMVQITRIKRFAKIAKEKDKVPVDAKKKQTKRITKPLDSTETIHVSTFFPLSASLADQKDEEITELGISTMFNFPLGKRKHAELNVEVYPDEDRLSESPTIRRCHSAPLKSSDSSDSLNMLRTPVNTPTPTTVSSLMKMSFLSLNTPTPINPTPVDVSSLLLWKTHEGLSPKRAVWTDNDTNIIKSPNCVTLDEIQGIFECYFILKDIVVEGRHSKQLILQPTIYRTDKVTANTDVVFERTIRTQIHDIQDNEVESVMKGQIMSSTFDKLINDPKFGEDKVKRHKDDVTNSGVEICV